ncbi:MAG: peptidylprolyl isomerase [Actinobacteria bacterium]|nr:peptidylprolyl isomerase [Actinomycetota bacterium]
MGTDKRERQKANRAAKLQAQAAQDKVDSRRRGAIGFVVVIAAVAAIAGLIYLGKGSSKDSASASSTTVAMSDTAPATTVSSKLVDKKFTFGTTPCPPADGSAKRTLTFSAPPKNCLVAGKSYTATFDTSAGKVVVALDTTNTPGTANNFVFLSRYGYYDNTQLFRVNSGIDIIQGGSPHTQSNADPGPGYTLKDEGKFNADATLGGYKYTPGDLVMARSSGPNSAGAQFFFATGEKTSQLDSQGTYVVFGHVTEGLDVLQHVVSTAKVDSSGEGAPNPEVTVKSVTISQS